MARIIVAPDDLERFARSLRRFTDEVSEGASELQGQFAGLGQTWSDRQHAKFAEEFKQMMLALEEFTRAADEQIPSLLRRAQRVREYLDQR
ncbi:MAG: WXG100 family type VII secretion target [Chloroflexi bacterium]|nr:WXG100 family type VII secretion target [Chloroflexota bacterium]